MSFVSSEFLVLFAVVYMGRLTIGRRSNNRAYIGLLIFSSLVFYAWHVPVYLLILLASTSIDYVAAHVLGRMPGSERLRRRGVLAISLGTNLGLLGLFKYGDFLLRTAGETVALAGLTLTPPLLGILLPIGISFYTFEAMSYTIDVYRGRVAPIRSLPKFVLFISFFPHLVAGPIVRAWQFFPQISKPRRSRLVVFYEGLWLLITGYFLKTVCADNLAALVNADWNRGYQDGTGALFAVGMATMFSGQILADFAGYSNIARGLAYLLGYRLPVNFNAPYLAMSFKNFWERWHITLSRWLRDYLYISLGGNRRSERRTYLNLIIVMTLGGLWHGAALTFIVWGLLHGGALAVERALRLTERKVHLAWRMAWFVVVQAVVLLAWVFFRSDSMGHAMQFIANIVSLQPGPRPEWAAAAALFLLPLIAWHAWTWLEERGNVRDVYPLARVGIATVMLWAILAVRGRPGTFIYFQF